MDSPKTVSYSQERGINPLEAAWGTVQGTYRVVRDTAKGVAVFPGGIFWTLTALNVQSDLAVAADHGYVSKIEIGTRIAGGVGATYAGMIAFAFEHNRALAVLDDHPYLAAIPLVTNLLSFGLERYRRDKEGDLESILPE